MLYNYELVIGINLLFTLLKKKDSPLNYWKQDRVGLQLQTVKIYNFHVSRYEIAMA